MAVSKPRARGRSRNRGDAGRDGPALLDDLLVMAGSLASSRKEFASAQLGDLAASVRQFSDSLPSLPTVKTYVETAAESLEDLASYVLDSDLPDIIADAREIARRHPLVTFGGSVVAGLVLTQLAQSRADTMREVLRARHQSNGARGRTARSTRSADEAA